MSDELPPRVEVLLAKFARNERRIRRLRERGLTPSHWRMRRAIRLGNAIGEQLLAAVPRQRIGALLLPIIEEGAR